MGVFGTELLIYQLCGFQLGNKNLRIILEIWENYIGASVNRLQVICNLKKTSAQWTVVHLRKPLHHIGNFYNIYAALVKSFYIKLSELRVPVGYNFNCTNIFLGISEPLAPIHCFMGKNICYA